MKTLVLTLTILLLAETLRAQTRIIGSVSTYKGLPLYNVNILIKNSYDGTSSDSTGHFYFTSSKIGKNVLQFSSMNYNTDSLIIDLKDKVLELHLYLTQVFKKFTVLYVSANNILGLKNIYGYNYSADGQYRQPVQASARRDFFIGLLMTIGDDTFVR